MAEQLYWACDSCESARPTLPKDGPGDTRPCPHCANQGMGDDYVEVVVSRGLVVPPLADKQVRRFPKGQLSLDEALEALWHGKDWENPDDVFLWADLRKDTEMHIWNGTHPVEDNTTERTAPKGSTVLVTVVSRLGDVGIRDDKLNPPSHGYYARVLPEELTNWRTIPTDAPTDWEGPEELEARSNLIEVKPNRAQRRAEKARNRKR